MINIPHSMILIVIASVITFALRAIPFLLFQGTNQMPPRVKKIADLLPPAIMAVLVIYCLRWDLANPSTGSISTFIAVFTVILAHLWKRNTLLSIFMGTAVYMLCIRIFPQLI